MDAAVIDAVQVLHVDDEPGFADTAGTFVERQSERLTVESATSVDEGLDRLDGKQFDCVVSDHDMPGKNGIEFLKLVRREYGDLPFILFTGKGSEEIASEAISAGVTDYLQKESGTDQYTVLANRIVNASEAHRAERDLDRRNQQDEAIASLSRHALEGTELHSLFDRATDLVSEHLMTDYAKVLELSADQESLQVVAGAGWDEDVIGSATMGTGQESQAGYVLSRSEPVVVEDFETEDRFETPSLFVDSNIVGGISVIIGSIDDPWGVLEAHTTVERTYSEDDVRYVQNMANILGTAIDRNTSEQQLRESETRFREIAELSPDTIFRMDTAGEFIYVSPAVESLLGYEPDELVGTNFQPYVTEESMQTALDAFSRACSGGIVRKCEIALTGAQESAVDIELSANPVEEDGEVVLVQGFVREITDRKEREQELERARDLIDRTARIADVGGWEIDTETQDVFWTEHLFDILGVDYDEEPPLDEALDVYHEDDRSTVESAVDSALESGVPFDVEVRFRRSGGEIGWLRVQGVPQTSDGEVVSLRGAVQDITEQKRTERELQQESELVTGIVETSPVGIAVVDDTGNISFANDRAEVIYGRSRDEVSGFSHDDSRLDLVDESGEQLDAGLTPFERVVSDREPIYEQVVGIRKPNGKRVWLSVNGAPQLGEDGDLERAVFAFEDVTEQRELEAELREILGRVTDAFFALDDEFRFTHVNERAEELLRATEDELIGESLWDLYPEATEVDAIWDAFHDAMDTQESQSYDVYYDPLDFWVEATVYPSESGVSVYFRDITERKAYEQRRERQTERLAEFASVVSHDLRNPLTVAEGQLELVQEEVDNEHLDAIEDAHSRMKALIEDILALAREGETVTSLEPTDIETVATESWENVQTANASLVIESERTIQADSGRLKQVFENLFRNAIEHGGTDVTVTLGEIEEGFFVADDGAGVQHDAHDKVFDAGYSTNQDGTGFGLSIVKQIVEAHDWEVTVTESRDGGARFDFTGVSLSGA